MYKFEDFIVFEIPAFVMLCYAFITSVLNNVVFSPSIIVYRFLVTLDFKFGPYPKILSLFKPDCILNDERYKFSNLHTKYIDF